MRVATKNAVRRDVPIAGQTGEPNRTHATHKTDTVLKFLSVGTVSNEDKYVR